MSKLIWGVVLIALGVLSMAAMLMVVHERHLCEQRTCERGRPYYMENGSCICGEEPAR
jgi:hypothetical protein